jgi:hypothetical protein
MIELESFETCVCKRRGVPSDSCADQLVLQEKGKKVTLKPKIREQAKLLIFDKCLINDNQLRCDAIFFLETESKAFMILTELKGEDINHAFQQLVYTREKRSQYALLKTFFDESTGKTINEEAFVISNYQISKVGLQRLEKSHGIRVKAVLHSEASTPMPDLRNWF